MNKPTHLPSASDDAIVRALIAHPDALELSYHETMVELMTDLAEGTLTGESLVLARQLYDTDENARELYQLLSNLPQVATTEPFAPIIAVLSAVIEELRGFFHSLTPAPNTALASGGKLRSEKRTITLGNFTATLSINERPSGEFDVDISIPAAAVTDPSVLEGLLLKVVDQPRFLVFHLTSDGHYVATQPLPCKIDEPGKGLSIERVDLDQSV